MKYSQTFKTNNYEKVQKETAVLLKEKGFDLPSRQYFISVDDKIKNTQNNTPYNWNKIPAAYTAPLLYEATIWLRETKGVHVYVKPQWSTEEWFGVVSIYAKNRYTENFKNHDEALEAGIVHALKHYVK